MNIDIIETVFIMMGVTALMGIIRGIYHGYVRDDREQMIGHFGASGIFFAVLLICLIFTLEGNDSMSLVWLAFSCVILTGVINTIGSHYQKRSYYNRSFALALLATVISFLGLVLMVTALIIELN